MTGSNEIPFDTRAKNSRGQRLHQTRLWRAFDPLIAPLGFDWRTGLAWIVTFTFYQSGKFLGYG